MSHPFIFLCPVCKKEDTIKKNSCCSCGVRLKINANDLSINGRVWTFSELRHWMYQHLTIRHSNIEYFQNFNNTFLPEEPIRVSRTAVLRQGNVKKEFRAYKGIFSRTIEKPVAIARGHLILLKTKFYFYADDQFRIFNYRDLSCVTTNGNYFVFKVKYLPFYQIKFQYESPLKYEFIFQKILQKCYSLNRIIEYQPKIQFHNLSVQKKTVYLPLQKKINFPLDRHLIKKILLILIKLFFFVFTRISISGRQNLPKYKPFFILANHQSILDPFVVLSSLSSEVAFLTKSTSFIHWYEKLFLKLGMGIPTTRYQPDPIVVLKIRQALKLGIPVGIFPEGERCWDGQRQPFKMSVVKVLATFRQPIIPIVLKNTFGLLPRWRFFPRPQKIEIMVKPAFSLLSGTVNYDELRIFLEKQFDQL